MRPSQQKVMEDPPPRDWAVTLPSRGAPREMGGAEAEPQSEGNTLHVPELWER